MKNTDTNPEEKMINFCYGCPCLTGTPNNEQWQYCEWCTPEKIEDLKTYLIPASKRIPIIEPPATEVKLIRLTYEVNANLELINDIKENRFYFKHHVDRTFWYTESVRYQSEEKALKAYEEKRIVFFNAGDLMQEWMNNTPYKDTEKAIRIAQTASMEHPDDKAYITEPAYEADEESEN